MGIFEICWDFLSFHFNEYITYLQYLSDGNQVEMPEGFPKAETDLNEDEEAEFTLRFKRGGNIIYDPIVETGDDIGDYIPNTGKSIHTFSSLLMVLCLALLLVSLN